MKSNHHEHRIFKFSLSGWSLAVLALTFCFAVTARATDPIYQNFSVLNYTVPGTPPPTIDASNFDNENQFNISFESASISGNAQFYEPMNTVNYTNKSSGINTGIMTVDSPFLTNGFFITDYNFVGTGFQFDTQTTNTIPHREAGTFYNAGDIRCDSILDGNNVINFQGFQFFDLIDLGQCRVWATNIICPGTIDTSEDGYIKLTGDNVDLSHAVLTLEQGLVTSNNVDVTINSEGAGYDTNLDWDPFFALTATNAYSSLPDNLYLSFPTSYFQVLPLGPTNMLVRAVFIVNANTNVPASVYIAPAAFNNEGALIQWAGTYRDPVTGIPETNYLYLFHFYFNSTNIPPILSVGTVPVPGDEGFYDNFLWQQGTPYPALPAPTPPGFQNIFNNNIFTNIYEFFNATLTGSTVGTNANLSNPSGALTNLPARIEITANKELKMDLAQISGENYLSLTATNQFDGSPGGLIFSPYSDINLGVTNGYPHPLTISNLLASSIPQWGGTLDEWSTRWTNTDANGINWDYRVMLVYSDLTPAVSPQVQNLTLTASNVVISDILNVFGSMFANAQSLTLTTNYYASGATSPDGELDMQLEDPLTWSWNGSFPNLLWLTNCGAIQTPNFSDFVSSSSATNIIPAIPPVEASATLAETGPSNNIAAGGTVTIGSTSYLFVSRLTNTMPFQVKVGANFNGSMSNLIAAINRGAGPGTNYSTNTFANSLAGAGLLNVTTGSFVVSANSQNYPGTLGNGIPVSTTVTNLAWNSSVLAGGVDGIPGSTNIISTNTPYGAIINNGYIADQGTTMWVTNFLNSGVISNGPGSFDLTSFTATMTNGSLIAGGDVSLTANTLLVSNLMLQAGRSLTLQVTNFLTDGSVSNGNVWAVGATNGTGGNGLILPFLPANTANTAPEANNLLGTTISLVTPPPNKEVASTWAGLDYGANTIGYTTNNVAIGQLILNSLSLNSTLYFTGPASSTTSNAIYVDRLVLENYASLAAREGSAGIPTLAFNNNPNGGGLTIYYADAISTATVTGGPFSDISYLLNGLNGGHLVWVPEYTGYFSGTNVMYPSGSIVRLNTGLAVGGGNARLDSNGDGTPNAGDSTPVFVGSQIDFQEVSVGNSNKLTWHSPPGSTNFVICTTNLVSWNVAAAVTNAPTVPPPSGWPITNVVYQPLATSNCWYRVKIIQNNSILYGQ
jgi:hypothetical protein